MGRKRREIKPKWQTKQTQHNTQNGIQQKIIKRKKSNSANRNVYSLEVLPKRYFQMNKSVPLKLRVIDWFNNPPEIFSDELNYTFLTESQSTLSVLTIIYYIFKVKQIFSNKIYWIVDKIKF